MSCTATEHTCSVQCKSTCRVCPDRPNVTALPVVNNRAETLLLGEPKQQLSKNRVDAFVACVSSAACLEADSSVRCDLCTANVQF